MDGSVIFDRLRQYPLFNTMLPWAHRCPHPKRHLDLFSRFCTAHGTIHNGPRLIMCALDPIQYNFSLGLPESTTKRQLIDTVFAGLTTVTDRLTDRATYHATPSVTIGRIYVGSAAMRPKR